MATSENSSRTTGNRLEGKVAIVTGGGSGFGEGIAYRFASEGAKVVISDINSKGGERVAATNPSYISFVEADVTSVPHWDNLVSDTISKYGRLDILVNNAGTSYKNKPTLEVTEKEFDMVMNVNVKSIFLGTSAVVKRFLEQKQGGSIINIASVGATRPRPGLVWYNASKAAVANATKGLAAEYAPHQIRINSICPLLSGTGLFEQFTGVEHTPENVQKFLSNVPLGRLTEALDVANACLFLASRDSAFITGVNLEVDGGRAI
ncbi:MAG: short-chain dehydrogenase reductase family [Trebouxia sp. A1-2]|nr:MAG: short-chain dehydrogenase reductase family [Trebouxia sp. A1-2]